MSVASLDLHSEITIAAVAAASPATIRVFQRHGIDFCCGGKRPLADVCSEKGLDFASLAQELRAAAEERNGEPDWTRARFNTLIAHILVTYHEALRDELPRLLMMADKVARVHGEQHPETREVRRVLAGFVPELERHMIVEEDEVFPRILQIERDPAGRSADQAALGDRLAALEREHETAGSELAELRALTTDYTPPAGACNTYRGLYWGLGELERTMHRHVHLENNILFPRALALHRGAAQG
ncbi:MAG: iron-sulfur cluster repair di-iron protein [Acidobacteriota bacterium]